MHVHAMRTIIVFVKLQSSLPTRLQRATSARANGSTADTPAAFPRKDPWVVLAAPQYMSTPSRIHVHVRLSEKCPQYCPLRTCSRVDLAGLS